MAKAKQHKKQHFVPACYLKAWCDPACPPNQQPYVWMFDRDAREGRAKSPENIFHETDMYTIQRSDGERDLVLERGLSQLETQFTRIRNSKLVRHRDLSDEERGYMSIFAAAAHARTKANREHWRGQWQRPLKVVEDLEKRMKDATLEQKREMARMSPPSLGGERGIGIDELRRLADNPLQESMTEMIGVVADVFMRMNMAFLTTDQDPGFISSDAPCTLVDPEVRKLPPFYRGIALGSRTVEVTLPISPSICMLLSWRDITGYIPVDASMVESANRATRFHAHEYFVVRRNHTEPAWFDPGVMPDDAWEKTHPPVDVEPADRS